MKFLRSLLSLAALIAVIGFAGAPHATAQPAPAPKTVDVVGVGKVVVVDREQLRFKSHTRTFRKPPGEALAAVPNPPTLFDWTKGGTLKFPILGNNRYGDCYYAAVAHGSQVFTGNAGMECEFDEQKLISRYLQLSGGDNGLSDGQIMPEWKRGIIGPDGPRKILDEMTVSVRDKDAQQLAAWAFGGLIWTCDLQSGWAGKPGAVWDADRGRGVGGHAMFLTGKNASGNWDVQTWGIGPPYVQVTPRGVLDSDSEFIVAFSLDQFRPDGISAFTGLPYDEMAAIWASMGGKPLPPSPFPPPKPPVPPGPAPDRHILLAVACLIGGLLLGVVIGVLVTRRKK